jgi:hypothetical protein
MKIVKDVDELRSRAWNQNFECFIMLAGGVARSSKNVFYDSENETFSVINEIDDSEDMFTEEEMKTSQIAEAIKLKALIAY